MAWMLTAEGLHMKDFAFARISLGVLAAVLVAALMACPLTAFASEGTLMAGTEAVQVEVASDGAGVSTVPPASVVYSAHLQKKGWMNEVKNGGLAGLTGKSLRLEAFRIKVSGMSGGVKYRAHVQKKGWSGWVSNNAVGGTTGKSLRTEAIQVVLTGDIAKAYDVYYRVHVEKLGWLDWAKNGEKAGTEGCAFRVEAMQVQLIEKGKPVTVKTGNAFRSVNLKYRSHVQKKGWMGYVKQGATSGTTGKALRLEALKVDLGAADWTGSISYRAHVQKVGWMDPVGNNGLAGTVGKGRRLEALRMNLTGNLATTFDLYYRVHVQGIGWMGWAKNGASAGTQGYSRRVEAVQVKLVKKGAAAPGSTARPFIDYSKVAKARAKLRLSEDYRSVFVHGEKPAQYQKYIVLHDTEGLGSASGVIDWWASNGNRVAAHFIVNRDGTIVQCVPMDKIAHHAGFGNTGHNKKFGVTDESRDDKAATKRLSSGVADYGMNSYSIGIEMVHVGGGPAYTEAQLNALDNLIAYIDAYYGFKSKIIDHKMWRIGNSDTSPEFATYLRNYQNHRTHR